MLSTAPRPRPSPPGIVSLLDFDPDLGSELPPADRPEATMASRAVVFPVSKGRWECEVPREPALGYLVLHGALIRTVRVGRRQSLELLGPGDLIRPWDDDTPSLVTCSVTYDVLRRTAMADLDARFCRMIRPWPQLQGAIVGRGLRRARWQAVQAAIDAHHRIDERLILWLCHLAEQTGRVTSDGIVFDLPLSHRLLAQAVRAMRPSVTTGLLRLREAGHLVERGGQEWLLTHSALTYARALCAEEPTGAC